MSHLTDCNIQQELRIGDDYSLTCEYISENHKYKTKAIQWFFHNRLSLNNKCGPFWPAKKSSSIVFTAAKTPVRTPVEIRDINADSVSFIPLPSAQEFFILYAR